MVTKNMVIYRFLCSYKVLITMVPRDRTFYTVPRQPKCDLSGIHYLETASTFRGQTARE